MDSISKANYDRNRSMMKIIVDIILLIILAVLLFLVIQKGREDKVPKTGTLVQNMDSLIKQEPL